MSYTKPALLGSHNDLDYFDCESQLMNEWLKKRAVRNEKRSYSRTYVICQQDNRQDNIVVAYCSLCVGQVQRKGAIKKLQRNAPDPLPVMVLGRLATDKRHKKKGIATGLVKHAFSVTWECSKYAGVAALLVHALSDRAKDFYINRGFQESPISDTTLMIPISSIQLALESNANPEL